MILVKKTGCWTRMNDYPRDEAWISHRAALLGVSIQGKALEACFRAASFSASRRILILIFLLGIPGSIFSIPRIIQNRLYNK